jgi:hypothetical protein
MVYLIILILILEAESISTEITEKIAKRKDMRSKLTLLLTQLMLKILTML